VNERELRIKARLRKLQEGREEEERTRKRNSKKRGEIT